MNNLTINTETLPKLSVSQLAALPQKDIQEFDISLAILLTWVKLSRDRLNTALEQRYGEQARTSLLESGRYFGVTHISDGDLRVTYELPKRVSWDQPQLAQIAERIVAAGERIQDYMDIDLSVSESRFNNWPPALKEQFATARTVKPGKASFRLAFIQEHTKTLHQSLQAKLGSFSGEHLTTTIRYLDRGGNVVDKPLFDASLDEVAFAIQTFASESSALHRRRSALENLYTLAREHACLGQDTVGQIALEVTK